MNKFVKLTIVLLWASFMAAQTTPTRVRSVTTLPATCQAGDGIKPADQVVLIASGFGTLYVCAQTNVWITAVQFSGIGTIPYYPANGITIKGDAHFTTDGSGNFTAVTGTFQGGASGGFAGFGQGTAPSFNANTFYLYAPTSIATSIGVALPATLGTVNQALCLTSVSSPNAELGWCATGSGTPGGSTGNLQYNNSGAFGGFADGTSHQVLHGGRTFSQVDVTADITGLVPKVNLLTTTVFTDQLNTFGLFAQTFRSGADFVLSDPTTATKTAILDLSNITATNQRTINVPDANSTTAQAKGSTSHQFLTAMSAQGVFSAAQPADADISFTNITTGNVTTSAHGFTPILPNDATKYLDGTGSYSVPAGSGTGTVNSVNISTNLSSFLTTGGGPITNTGTLTVNGATGLTGNEVVASPDNTTGAVSLRALVGRDMPATVAQTNQINTFGLFAQTFRSGSDFVLSDPTTSSKTAIFDLSNITASNQRTVNVPDANSTLAQSVGATSHQFLTAMSAQGVFSQAQPAFSDISGTASTGQLPNIPLNQVVSPTGSIATFAFGDTPLTFNAAATTTNRSMFTFGETSAGTSTGTPYLVNINTLSTSTLNPWVATAQGTANGVQVLKSGFLTSKGTGGVDSNLLHCDVTTSTKCMQFVLSGITASNTRTVTIPDANSATVIPDTGAANNFLTAISASGAISKAQPAFSNLSGSLACGQTPALTGDTTTSAGACGTTTAKVNGVSYPASPTVGTIPNVSSSNTVTYIDFPDFHYFPAAACVNSTGASGWSVGGTPVPTCRAGTNNKEAYLLWGTTDTAQFSIGLPLDWDSSTNPNVSLQLASTDATNGHTIIMQIATACGKGDGSVTDDVAFNSAQSLGAVTLNGNASREWKTTLSSITMTGCTAGGILRFQLSRTTDTATNVEIYGLGLTIPRKLVVQAN